MGRVIGLFGDPHEEARSLLPWYVTGRIAPEDRARVDAHLAHCGKCRADLAAERDVQAGMADFEPGLERDWETFRRRLDASPQSRSPWRPVLATARGFARPRVLGAVIAAQAAVVAALIVAPPPAAPPARYAALGSAPASRDGNILVMFRPELPERDLRRALYATGGRIVDGPTDAGAYVLRVAPAARAASLAGLRRDAGVLVAEPIDGG